MDDSDSIASSLTSASGSTLRLIASENAVRNQSIPAGLSELLYAAVRDTHRNVTFADNNVEAPSKDESNYDAFGDFNFFTGQYGPETCQTCFLPTEIDDDGSKQLSLQLDDNINKEPQRRPSTTGTPRGNRVAQLRRFMANRRAEKAAAAEAPVQKPKVLLTEAERQQRLARLAIPIAGKFEAPPQPPKLSTDCPDLPASGIDEIQSKSTDYRQGPFVKLPPSTERLRWTISALVDKTWSQKYQESVAQEYSYGRADVCRNEPLQFSGPLVEPAELRNRLFDRTDLEGDISADTASNNYALRQLRHFLTSFKMGFICLALDMQMQVIGTYDPSLGQYLPGIDLGPMYLRQNRTPQANDSSRANLLEIRLEELPKNVFAVVPVLLDESNVSRTELVKETSLKRSLFQDLKFQIESFVYNVKTDAEVAEEAAQAVKDAYAADDQPVGEPTEEYVVSLCDGLTVEAEKADDESSTKSEPDDPDIPSEIQMKLRQLRKQKRVRTAEEEEEWLRQSWSLDVPVAASVEKSKTDAKADEKSRPGSPVSISGAKGSGPKNVNNSISLQTPSTPTIQSPAQRPLSAPSPNRSPANSRRSSLRPTPIPEEPKKPTPRWRQMSRTEFGRMLPTQLRSLFRDSSAGDDDYEELTDAEVEDVSDWRSCNAVFGVGDGFAPVVIFRRSAYVGGWAMKPLNLRLPRCGQQIDVALKSLLGGLVSNYIVPFHVIHVEHCRNCEDHQWTTWHLPGSYERAYRDFRRAIKKRLPPSLILSNLPHISSAPRVGSFEVLIRPYFSTVTRSMHSKLQSNKFPDYGELVEELSPQMLPAIVRFDGSRPVLEVLAFDSLTQKPIHGAEVSIYRLNITVLMAHENLEGSRGVVADEDPEEELEQKVVSDLDERPHYAEGDRPTPKPGSSSNKKDREKEKEKDRGRGADKEGDERKTTRPRSGSPKARRSIVAISRDGRKKSTATKEEELDDDDFMQVDDRDMKLAKKDLAIRQTQAYKNTCTWTRFDVAAWFREFGAAPDVLANATVDGVIDGPSFCKLVTIDALKKWGVRSKRTLRKLEDGLKFINQGEGSEEANRLIKEFAMSVGATGMSIDVLSGATMQKDASGKKTLGYGAVAASSALWMTSAGVSPSAFGADAVGRADDEGLNYDGDLENSANAVSTQRHQAVTQFRRQLRSLGGGRDPLEYQVVFRGTTSETGLCRAKIPISGTYIIKISTGSHVSYSSNAIRVLEAERILYAAALKPAVVVTVLYASIAVPNEEPESPQLAAVNETDNVTMSQSAAVNALEYFDEGGDDIRSRRSSIRSNADTKTTSKTRRSSLEGRRRSSIKTGRLTNYTEGTVNEDRLEDATPAEPTEVATLAPEKSKSLADKLSFPKYGCLTAMTHLPTGRRYLICLRLAQDIETVEIIMPPAVEDLASAAGAGDRRRSIDTAQGGATTGTGTVAGSTNRRSSMGSTAAPGSISGLNNQQAASPAATFAIAGMNMGYLNFEVPKKASEPENNRNRSRRGSLDSDEERQARRKAKRKLRKKMNNDYMFGDSDDEAQQPHEEEKPVEQAPVVVEPPQPQEIVHTTRLCARELRLPAGPYLSEVDGSVVRIQRGSVVNSSSITATQALLLKDDDEGADNPADEIRGKVNTVLEETFPSTKSYVTHADAAHLRCHRRLLRHAVILLQRFVRIKLEKKMMKRMKLIGKIHKHAPGYIAYVRSIVLNREARVLQRSLRSALLRKKFHRTVSAAIVVQSLVRMRRARMMMRYFKQEKYVLVLQRMLRGFLVRRRIRVWHWKARVITRFVRTFIRFLGWRNNLAALTLQCAYRCYCARVMRRRKVVAQHGLTLVVCMIRFMWRCRRGYTKAREREYRESIRMHQEELRTVKHLEHEARLIAEEKRRDRQRAELKLKQIEAKKAADLLRKGKMLIKVQAAYRGYIGRKKVRNLRKAIVKLQNYYRRRVCMKKFKRIMKLVGSNLTKPQPHHNQNLFTSVVHHEPPQSSGGGGGVGVGRSATSTTPSSQFSASITVSNFRNFLVHQSSVMFSRDRDSDAGGTLRVPLPSAATSAFISRNTSSDSLRANVAQAPAENGVSSMTNSNRIITRRQSSQGSEKNSMRRRFQLAQTADDANRGGATLSMGHGRLSRIPSLLRRTGSDQFAITLPTLHSEKAVDKDASAAKLQSFARMIVARRKYRGLRGNQQATATQDAPMIKIRKEPAEPSTVDNQQKSQVAPLTIPLDPPDNNRSDINTDVTAQKPLIANVAEKVATARRSSSQSRLSKQASRRGAPTAAGQSSDGAQTSSEPTGKANPGAQKSVGVTIVPKPRNADLSSPRQGLVPSAVADAPLLQGIRGFLLARRAGASRLAGTVSSLLRRRSKTEGSLEQQERLSTAPDKNRAATLVQAMIRGAMCRTRLYRQPDARRVFEKIIFGSSPYPYPVDSAAGADDHMETPRGVSASMMKGVTDGSGGAAMSPMGGKSLFVSPPPSEIKFALTGNPDASAMQSTEISRIDADQSEIKLRRPSQRGRRTSRASYNANPKEDPTNKSPGSAMAKSTTSFATGNVTGTSRISFPGFPGPGFPGPGFPGPGFPGPGFPGPEFPGPGFPLSPTRSKRMKDDSPLKSRIDDYLQRANAPADRALRRRHNEVGLCDAVLHVTGGLSNQLPRIDFEWYMGVYFMGEDARTNRRGHKSGNKSNDKLALQPHALAPFSPVAAKTPSKYHPVPTEIDGVKLASTPFTPMSTIARHTRTDFDDALSHPSVFFPATGPLTPSAAKFAAFSPGSTAAGFPSHNPRTNTLPKRPPPPAPKDMAMKSAVISSLSAHSFDAFNYTIHLTELDRYYSLQLVLIIDAIVDEKVFLNPDATNTPLLAPRYGDIARPVGGFKIVQKKVKVSAFSGTLHIQQGMIFGPQGGRMNVTLVPNVKGIDDIPALRPLLAVEELHATVTLFPTARPSSTLLRMYRTVARPAPCYPSVLVDADLLQPSPFKWVAGYGMPLTAISHKDRLLMSVHKSSKTLSVAEYETSGKFVAKVCDAIETMGPVHLMFSGHNHVLCCGSRGGAVALQLLADLPAKASRSFVSSKKLHYKRKRGSRTDEDLQIHFRRLEETEFEGEDRWSVPVPLRKHHSNKKFDSKRDIILGGCVLATAGLDMFFTVNVVGAVSVHLMHRGEELRSFFNAPFLPMHGKITAIAAFGRYLYVGMQDGYIIVIGLQAVFEGRIEMLGRLSELVVRQDAFYAAHSGETPVAKSKSRSSRRKHFADDDDTSEAEAVAETSDDFQRSVTCMAVVSPNGFLGLRDEDEVIRTADHGIGHPNNPGIMTMDPEYFHNTWAKDPAHVAAMEELLRGDVVEGHLLLVGGSDGKGPCVKVLRPSLSGMVERATLRGGQSAITHILVDAAGRHIILGSIGDRRVSIFDGLTFKCERIFDDVSIDSMALTLDTLIVVNHKLPFIRAWTVSTGSEDQEKARDFGRKALFKAQMSNRRVDREIRKEDITSVRNVEWSRALLRGAFASTITEPACLPVSQLPQEYAEEEIDCVITRWTNQLMRVAPSSTSAERVDWEGTPDESSSPSSDDESDAESVDEIGSHGGSLDDILHSRRNDGMPAKAHGKSTAAKSDNYKISNQETLAEEELAEVLKYRHRDVITMKPFHLSDTDDSDSGGEGYGYDDMTGGAAGWDDQLSGDSDQDLYRSGRRRYSRQSMNFEREYDGEGDSQADDDEEEDDEREKEKEKDRIRREVYERQKRLRPRMIRHLNDAMDSDVESEVGEDGNGNGNGNGSGSIRVEDESSIIEAHVVKKNSVRCAGAISGSSKARALVDPSSIDRLSSGRINVPVDDDADDGDEDLQIVTSRPLMDPGLFVKLSSISRSSHNMNRYDDDGRDDHDD